MIGATASQAFTPNKPPDLKLHLDPSDRGSIIDSGGNVSQKNDKSKNGDHATQFMGSSQPLTEVDIINGQNVITYDGDNDFLAGTPATALIPLADHTLSFVCRVPAVLDETQCVIAWNDSTGASSAAVNREVICFSTAGLLVIFGSLFTGNTKPIGGAQDFRGQEVIITLVVDHDTDLKTYINGRLVTTFSIDTPIVATVDTFNICTELDFGGALGNFFDGLVGEIIIYDAVVDTETFDAVHFYLSDKWGIALEMFPFLFSLDFSSDFS